MTAVARAVVRRLVPRALRNWVRSPGSSFAWLRDELRHKAGLDRRVEMRPGWAMVCHPAAYRLAYHVHHDDPPQVAELNAFIDACRPGMVLFDLGAHFGLFSFAALHYGGAKARAVAVEPSPDACRMMRLEAALNGVGNALNVMQAAAADRSEQRLMLPIGVIAAGYWSGDTGGYHRSDLQPVRAVTLDEMAAEHGLRPTHIKIDVEGFEAEVVRGGKGVLSAQPSPQLFVELHTAMIRDRGGDPTEATTLLEGLGYRFVDPAGATVSRDDVLRGSLLRVVGRRSDV